jgi:hypothetical protein
MIRSRPAPASRAKRARVSSNSSLLTPVARYQKPSPVAGETKAVVAAGDRALAARRPDPAEDRLQADPVLVGGEGLDRRAGMALRFLGDDLGELYGMARPSVDRSRSVDGVCHEQEGSG